MRQSQLIVPFLTILFVIFGFLSAGAEEKKAFRFPGGNAETGSEVFSSLNCLECHSVSGVHFEDPEKRRTNLPLANEVRFVKSYEDIMKAISNPRHVVNAQYGGLLPKVELDALAPFMKDFTSMMTLRQFIDLVTFLDKAYSDALEDDYGK